jgi:hypothetical protein
MYNEKLVFLPLFRSRRQFASGSLRLSLLPPGSGHRHPWRLLLQ